MKGTTIMIGLLGKPMGKHKAEGGLLESKMEMPEALMDESENRKNKANAVLKAQLEMPPGIISGSLASLIKSGRLERRQLTVQFGRKNIWGYVAKSQQKE